MKKVIFCILILGVNSAFCMKWGNGILKDESIQFYTEGSCNPAWLAVAQRHLAYLDKRIDKVKGDTRTYLKLIQFVLQTNARLAWQEYEDKPGITPAQELMAFPMPKTHLALVAAARDFKKEILSRWTLCACYNSDYPASLEARKNALQHMLITGPEIFTDSVANCEAYRGRPGLNFLHFVNNIVKRIDFDIFRCEGVTIYQKIKDLQTQGKLNKADCKYWRNQHCFHSKVGCHMKLEQEKEILRPILGQALAGILPSTLYPIIVNYSAGNCDLLPHEKN